MNKYTRGIALHKKVIHETKEGHSKTCETYQAAHEKARLYKPQAKVCNVCAEEKFISKLSYNTLVDVCKDCFLIPKE